MDKLFKGKNIIDVAENPVGKINLKNGLKEDKDYKLLDDESWIIL
jgi:hypothetical protein